MLHDICNIVQQICRSKTFPTLLLCISVRGLALSYLTCPPVFLTFVSVAYLSNLAKSALCHCTTVSYILRISRCHLRIRCATAQPRELELVPLGYKDQQKAHVVQRTLYCTTAHKSACAHSLSFSLAGNRAPEKLDAELLLAACSLVDSARAFEETNTPGLDADRRHTLNA